MNVVLDSLSVHLRYRCKPEREQLRQKVYRAARKAGVRVSVLTDGGGYGWLRAVRVIEGKCIERRSEPRAELREQSYDPSKDEAGDIAAVNEMLRTMRTVVAEMSVKGERRATPKNGWRR